MISKFLFASVAGFSVFLAGLLGMNTPTSDVVAVRAFQEPLVALGGSGSSEDNAALVSTLHTYQKRKSYEDVSAITSYLDAHPDSPWKFSLLANLGIIYRKTGHFSRAVDVWEQAWALGKGEKKDVKVQALANRVASELASLLSSLGRTERLTSLLDETKGRTIYGTAGALLYGSHRSLWLMEKKPGEAYKCGPYALDSILTFEDRKKAHNEVVMKAQSGLKGFSLTQVRDLSNQLKMNYQMAKKSPGAAFIVPAVANWRSHHYAAVLKKEGDSYLTKDPTFNQDILVTGSALDDESSGYYLVPPGPLPKGWTAVSDAEGATVWGQGGPAPNSPGCTKDGCDGDEQTSCGCSTGMATYSAFLMNTSLSIHDNPVGYNPPVGPSVQFKITYNQLEDDQPANFNFFNFGPGWNCNWLAYVAVPSSTGGTVYVNLRGGGQETYNASTWTSTGSTYSGYVGYYGNQVQSQATLWVTTSGTCERRLPDGSKEVFGAVDPAGFIFLTADTDPQGNSLTFTYDSSYRLTTVTDALGLSTTLTYGLSGDVLKVTQITDPYNRSATFSYTNYSGVYQLTGITDVVGITSQFAYQSGTFSGTAAPTSGSGTVIGSAVTQMTTPYGATTFSSSESAVQTENGTAYGQVSSLRAVEPDGGETYVEERIDGSNYPSISESVPNVALGGNQVFSSSNLQYANYRNTYYWDKKAMLVAGNNPDGNYTAAHIYHFTETSTPLMESPVLESEKTALGNRVWHAYPGQAYASGIGSLFEGTSAKPIIKARVIDSTHTQVTQYQYNNTLNPAVPTAMIDSVGRQTNYTYDSTTGIDVTQVTQNNGGGTDTISSATYNSQHEPLTITDAAGQTTTYTYNSRGQITSITPPTRSGHSAETTTYTYTGNYLTSITRPMSGAVITLTYDTLNGHTVNRVKTRTDSEGYTLTYSYDNFDRITQILYPDSTTETFSYVNPATGNVDLDLHLSTDRLGRTTTKTYDSMRHLISVTDPLGRTTKYGWCTCGNMTSMTDPDGNVTQYNRDTESRLTSKVYADTTATSYTYDVLGRVATVTDARGDVTTYSYNLDNTLSGKSYSLASGTSATPNVSYTYDSVYHRLTSAGGVTLTYYPVGSLGALKPETVTNTLTGGSAAITYTYDEWGRRVGSNIDSANAVSVTFDSLGEVTNATNLLGSFTYTYYDPPHPTGRLGSISYPNGQSTSYSYFGNTGDEQLEEIKNLNPSSAVLSQNDYTRDAMDKILTWKQQTDSNTPTLWTNGYDVVDQLTSAVKTNTSTEATIATTSDAYDFVGNRTQELTATGTQTASAYNNLNQLVRTGSGVSTTFAGSINKPVTLTVNGQPTTLDGSNNFSLSFFLPGGTNNVPLIATDSLGNQTTNKYQVATSGSTVNPTYDADGNELTDENGNAYKWDAKSELASIIYNSGSNSGNHTEFSYDAMGHRIAIVERTGTTVGSGTVNSTKQFVWNGSAIAEERNVSNTVTKRFYGQGEQILGTSYYYTRDHLGSVREMCDSSGNLVTRLDYDPWGRVTVISGTTLPDFQYAGYYAHMAISGSPPDLNLTLFRAYDPNTARWLSRDPLPNAEMSQGPNLYLYCENNPACDFDPSGLTAYSQQQTQQILNSAAAQATAGTVQGLTNMYKDNSGGGIYDFGANDPNNQDTYNVNGTTLTSDQFGNYIAGYEGQAYDEAYLTATGCDALLADYLAGLYYHNVCGGSKDPNDPLDKTGFPYISAGAAGYDNNFGPLNQAMQDPAAHPSNAQQPGGRRG